MSQFEEEHAVVMPFSETPPTKWEYNGNTFELDLGDAEDADHLEQVFGRFSEAEKTLQKAGGLGDMVRGYDKLFRDFYDDLFGEGAGDAILGERKNMNNCDNAFDSFLTFIDGQNSHFMSRMASINARYSGNRAQRRNTVYRRG